MTYNEIEACVSRAKNGSQEDLLKISQQYKYFIIKTAKDFNIRNHDVYDLLQIGYITLIKAVNMYKIGYHCFSNYAYTSVKNAFRYTARQNSKFSDEISLYATADFDDSPDAEYMDFIAADEDLEETVINCEDIEEVREAIS
jgi:RNA polymerase sigma factor (sigma-70 family)